MDTALVNGHKYGLVIVDYYNRWTWEKFLRCKDDSYDHGGELGNEPFDFFCETHGILHDFSSRRTPQ